MAAVPARPLDPQHGCAAALVAGGRAHAPLVDHRGVDRARRHAVDADTVLPVIDGHGTGEGDHRALGHSVDRQPPRPQRGDRRHVDDGAAASADHGGDGVLGGQEHGLDVDLHDAAVFLRLLVDH